MAFNYLKPGQLIQDYIEGFEDASLEQLIFIPASLGEGVLTDFLNDLDDEDWKELFPAIHQREDFSSIYTSHFNEDKLEALIYGNYYGFIGTLRIPVKNNIVFDDDAKIASYTSSGGHVRLFNIYFNSICELADIVTIKNNESTQTDIHSQLKKDARKGAQNAD